MGQDGSSKNQKDNFFDAIEDAVDNLFTQYEKKDGSESKPAATEPKAVELVEPMEATGPEPTMESTEPAEPTLDLGGMETFTTLLEELNEAFLTIDWEVSQANVGAARNILTNIQEELGQFAASQLSQMIDLMNQVLEAISSAPESVPTSGPKALQNGLQVLAKVSQQEKGLDATTESLIESACEELKDSLPQATPPKPVELELEIEDSGSMDETIPVPSMLITIMRSDLTTLNLCLNRLRPIENLFAGKPGYAKLIAIYQKLREAIQHQKNIFTTALDMDYHAAPSDESPPIPTELSQILQSHITIMGQCKSRIQPLETLFSKKTKLEKLYNIHQKVRLQFEDQIDVFTRALQGDYKPASPRKTSVPLVEQACPWASLRLAQWKGKVVALAPDHIIYENIANRWTRKNLKTLAAFSLKKLKPWPWSKLQSMLSGELAQLPEQDLKQLILPVLNHPDPVQHKAVTKNKYSLVILYHQEKGGVMLLDQPTTELEVNQEWRWQPSKRSGSTISGFLKTAEENIPVIGTTNL